MTKTQKLLQVRERDCSVPVFASLAQVSPKDLLADFVDGRASSGQVSLIEWERWLDQKGFDVLRRDGCQTDILPCAHLVAMRPNSEADFHWVYRDEDGDVHDPSPVSVIMSADDPWMRNLKSYDVKLLTLTVSRRNQRPMTPHTDREIIVRFQNLFDTDGDFTTTAMHRGFENVGPGWLPVMTQLCERLVPLTQADFRLLAVKSKYATLRVHCRGGDDVTDTVVADAQAVAARTCEFCGGPGEQRVGGDGGRAVRCAACAVA